LNPQDPNVQLVESVAAALGDLCAELVFVGGCATGLLYTSVTAPVPRVTYDVDVIAEVTGLPDYYALERRISAQGFRRDTSNDAPICRWRLGEITVDLMPSDERILGFSNRWYPQAIVSALPTVLPSGLSIRLIAAPVFLATKLEAFATRGRGDLMVSHDIEDVINVIDGRSGIVDEVAAAENSLRTFLAGRFDEILRDANFSNTLPGLLTYDEIYDERVRRVRERIEAIARLRSG
jgi:predicted nucleotidyltransferase